MATKRFLAILLLLLPLSASAATIEEVFDKVEEILTQSIGLLIVIATLVFMWGIIRYVAAGGDEEKVREGRNMMLFGIIGLAVMISVWGIVKLITTTFGVGGEAIPVIEEP